MQEIDVSISISIPYSIKLRRLGWIRYKTLASRCVVSTLTGLWIPESVSMDGLGDEDASDENAGDTLLERIQLAVVSTPFGQNCWI